MNVPFQLFRRKRVSKPLAVTSQVAFDECLSELLAQESKSYIANDAVVGTGDVSSDGGRVESACREGGSVVWLHQENAIGLISSVRKLAPKSDELSFGKSF